MEKNIDNLDLQILNELMQNAEITYDKLGKKLFVSGGTVHVRIKKLLKMKVIKGTKMKINQKLLDYDVTAFLNILLEKDSFTKTVVAELNKIEKIIRINCITGEFNIMVEIACKNIQELNEIIDKIRKIKNVGNVKSFISLDETLNREIKLIN